MSEIEELQIKRDSLSADLCKRVNDFLREHPKLSVEIEVGIIEHNVAICPPTSIKSASVKVTILV